MFQYLPILGRSSIWDLKYTFSHLPFHNYSHHMYCKKEASYGVSSLNKICPRYKDTRQLQRNTGSTEEAVAYMHSVKGCRCLWICGCVWMQACMCARSKSKTHPLVFLKGRIILLDGQNWSMWYSENSCCESSMNLTQFKLLELWLYNSSFILNPVTPGQYLGAWNQRWQLVPQYSGWDSKTAHSHNNFFGRYMFPNGKWPHIAKEVNVIFVTTDSQQTPIPSVTYKAH